MNKVKVHEHITRIAEPGISRARLWQGLVDSVRSPEKYVEHMESSKIVSEEITDVGTLLQREIDFGNFRLQDRVILRENQSLLTVVDKGPNWKASTFLIRIEEPESGVLFLRFVYEEEGGGEALPEMFLRLRQQAYEAKDRKLVEQVLDNIATKVSN